ncbi:MAG: hypothetical protein ACRDGS_09475 [Chloroflexota bacterium]
MKVSPFTSAIENTSPANPTGGGEIVSPRKAVADQMPALLTTFLDVPSAVTKAGFLSPAPGNDFPYQPASASLPGVSYTAPVTT